MAEEPFALTIPAPPATEADYDTICAAVMETGRGRWFLAEYARRNRNADTQILLAALERIEAAIRREPVAPPAETPLADSETDAIKTEAIETEAMKPDAGDAGKGALPQNLANALENTTAAIRAATEHLQDVAWRLRELQYDDRFCDEIDAGIRDIAAACVALEDAAARRMAAPIAEPASGVGAAPETTVQDAPSEPVAAFAQPQDFAPASESAAPQDTLESAWGLAAAPQDGGNPPEPEPIAAAQALSENAWDRGAVVRAFETEATPAVSLWQLPEETGGTDEPPAEARHDAAAAEGSASLPEPAAFVADAAPAEGGAEAIATIESAAAMPDTGSRSDDIAPQPAAAAPEDRTQERIRHALSQATAPEPEQLPRGGWLSNLLTRIAQGEADEDTDESGARRDNEIATAPKATLPAAAAPAEFAQAEPVAAVAASLPASPSEPPPEASAPDTPSLRFSALPDSGATSPRNALAAPESAVVEIQRQAIAEMPARGDAGTADMLRAPAHAPDAVETDATAAAAAAEANAREADAEDDPAGFLLEPLPAALTAGMARPQDIANTASAPQSAPRDPLAPIRALSEEEKIALFS